jgi:hypothetical protein
MLCAGSGTAQVGQYSNLATASGSGWPGGEAVSDTDPSHYFGSEPGLVLDKSTNGQDADQAPGVYIAVGDPVTWTYAVTNSGNVRLTDVAVTDDQGLAVSCPLTALAAGQDMVCQATGLAEDGQHSNLGSVVGTPPGGDVVTASDASHYFGSEAAIAIEKRTNGHGANVTPGPLIAAGEPVTWTYIVTNTGTVPLSDVDVVDSRGASVSCPATILPPGGAMTCQARGVAEPGQYGNMGTATGTPPGGLGRATASDASHYYGVDPRLLLEKLTNGVDADMPPGVFVPVGEPVVWSYK